MVHFTLGWVGELLDSEFDMTSRDPVSYRSIPFGHRRRLAVELDGFVDGFARRAPVRASNRFASILAMLLLVT